MEKDEEIPLKSLGTKLKIKLQHDDPFSDPEVILAIHNRVIAYTLQSWLNLKFWSATYWQRYGKIAC